MRSDLDEMDERYKRWKEDQDKKVSQFDPSSGSVGRTLAVAGGRFSAEAENIAGILRDKNAAYGDSFAKAGQFLELLFPDGVPPDSYTDMLTLVRIFDKMKRIATDKDALGENPYQDIAGYAILALELAGMDDA